MLARKRSLIRLFTLICKRQCLDSRLKRCDTNYFRRWPRSWQNRALLNNDDWACSTVMLQLKHLSRTPLLARRKNSFDSILIRFWCVPFRSVPFRSVSFHLIFFHSMSREKLATRASILSPVVLRAFVFLDNRVDDIDPEMVRLRVSRIPFTRNRSNERVLLPLNTY